MAREIDMNRSRKEAVRTQVPEQTQPVLQGDEDKRFGRAVEEVVGRLVGVAGLEAAA